MWKAREHRALAPLPLVAALGLASGCADRTPPAWPMEAAISARDVTGDALVVVWPAASDRRGVSGYRLERAGSPAVEIAADGAREVPLTGLTEFTEHAITVVAHDAAGNTSPPLAATLRTADVTSPRPAPGCRLEGERVQGDGGAPALVLRWCAATDNDRVARYEATRVGSPAVTVDGALTTVTVSDGTIAGRYEVQACDPTGNCRVIGSISLDEQGHDAAAKRDALLSETIRSSGVLTALLGSGSMAELSLGDSDWGALGEDGFGSLGEATVGGGLAVGRGDLGARGSGSGDWGGSATGQGRLGGLGSGSVASAGSSGPRARVEAGEPAALRDHATRRLPRVENCYRTALAADATLSGTVRVALTAAADGALTVGAVTGIGDDALATCVASALRGRLPEPPGAELSGSVALQLGTGTR